MYLTFVIHWHDLVQLNYEGQANAYSLAASRLILLIFFYLSIFSALIFYCSTYLLSRLIASLFMYLKINQNVYWKSGLFYFIFKFWQILICISWNMSNGLTEQFWIFFPFMGTTVYLFFLFQTIFYWIITV